MTSVGELLTEGTARLREAGSETPRLDAELLLGWTVGAERTWLLAHPEVPVGADHQALYREGLQRRASGEPVAYIRGMKEFYGLAFSVDSRVLIPRPETELLVGFAEREVVRRLTVAPRGTGTPPIRLVDVGTGSGAIAVALAVALRRRRMLPEISILATDASSDALDVARENAVAHAVADTVCFAQADLLPPDEPPFDIVLANLPYSPSSDIEGLPVAASFEPRAALDGGPDGLDQVRRLVARLPEALVPGGTALLEIGFDQADAVEAEVLRLAERWTSRIENDLSGLPRLLVLEREAEATRA